MMCLKLLKSKIKNQEYISNYDVSKITNMSYLFYYTPYNKKKHGDISKWNVSNVENMNFMFKGVDIPYFSEWDISNIERMIHFGIENIQNKSDFEKYKNKQKGKKKLGLFGNLIDLK